MLGMLFTKPVAMGIMAGLLLGKPLGITAFSLLGIKLGLAEMPKGMTTKHLAVLGLLGGIGFTMCLFLIALSLGDYPDSSRLSKLAVIAASGIAAIGGAAIMNTFPANKEDAHADEPAHGAASIAAAASKPTVEVTPVCVVTCWAISFRSCLCRAQTQCIRCPLLSNHMTKLRLTQ